MKMANCLFLMSTRGTCSRSGRRGLEWISSQSPIVAEGRSLMPSGFATSTSSTGSWVRRTHSTFSARCANENATNWTPAFARRKATAHEQDYSYYSSILMSALGLALATTTFYGSLPTSHCSADQSLAPLATSSMMAFVDGSVTTDQPPHPTSLLTFEKPASSHHHNQFKKAKRAAREVGEPYDISVRAIKGGRVTMEDEYFVAEGGRFVAVFDGHGGGGVSQFLKRNLYQEICRQLKDKHWEQTDLEGNQSSVSRHNSKRKKGEVPSVFAHVSALKAAFAEMEARVLANDHLGYQGSTAVAVLLHENPESGHRTLLSANVGDSRAILSRNGRAISLTRDHKPNDEIEKARILAMGETIEWDRYSKVHRVRNLSLSRAIGDRYAKPVVTGEVEIKHYPVMEEDEFVLLASDGLWDVMESQDVVHFVHQRLQEELSKVGRDDAESYRFILRKNMAKLVAREAIRRGSGDNVCVCMVWLNDAGN